MINPRNRRDTWRRYVLLFFVLGCATSLAQPQQELGHRTGHTALPFDLAKTKHIFRMTDAGGIKRVLVKEISAKDQVPLIQQHLQHEAEAFKSGNFSDAASLRDPAVPGMNELQAGAAKIKVSYTVLPGGAEIGFETTDRHLVTALHRWFGAQLSLYGAGASSE